MQLKFPKKIEIGDHTFTIVYNKKTSGGSFTYETLDMTIGTKHLEKSPETVFGIICHEIMEAITVVTNTSFKDYGSGGDYKFIASHKEFETNMMLFAMAIQKFIK
jgi:hypothetical protein